MGELWGIFTADIMSDAITTTGAIFRLVLSMVLGCCVGIQRKRKGQPAGVRTFSLISMGAALAMILSIYVPQEFLGLKNGDPGRIAAQVISGVGFLGAGAIIQMKGSVRGLTTAAGIWITAIIGMAVGVGMYQGALLATFICMIILVTVERYEHSRHIGQESKVLNVVVDDIVSDIAPYRKLFTQHNLHLSTFYIDYDYDAKRTVINFVVLVPTRSDILPVIAELRGLARTKSITLSSQIEL